MTRTIKLAKDQRLVIEHSKGIPILECHLEQINKNGHWNGRAWFHLTESSLDELMKELKGQ